jgi:hypothetical protein
VKLGSAQPIVRPTPEFATGPAWRRENPDLHPNLFNADLRGTNLSVSLARLPAPNLAREALSREAQKLCDKPLPFVSQRPV